MKIRNVSELTKALSSVAEGCLDNTLDHKSANMVLKSSNALMLVMKTQMQYSKNRKEKINIPYMKRS